MSPTLTPSVTDRDPKGQKFIAKMVATYNKANLSDDEAQRVNEAAGLSELVAKFIVENRGGRFADEDLQTSFTYPNGHSVLEITKQVVLLTQLFPKLKPEQTLNFITEVLLQKLTLPEFAEGWFAIPRWQRLARNYGSALEVILAKIRDTRTFHNYLEGPLDPNRLRQLARTAMMMEQVEAQQPGDILVIPAQFGKRHAGRSVRRAREVVVANEFLLGSVANGSMLLTHPPRLQVWDQLHIDAGGDEYSPDAVGQFGLAPFFLFNFNGGVVNFSARWVYGPDQQFGSSSGFLSQ